jgi:hypothetical protein
MDRVFDNRQCSRTDRRNLRATIRIRRAIQIAAGVTLVFVLAIFGREFVSDLF